MTLSTFLTLKDHAKLTLPTPDSMYLTGASYDDNDDGKKFEVVKNRELVFIVYTDL